MRITFSTPETFLSELTEEAKTNHIWQNQVRFRIDHLPEQKEEISFQVVLTLTALIELSDGGQYILEAICECGCNDPEPPDGQEPDAGTKTALAIMREVKRVANALGITVREGKLEQ